MIQKFNLEGIPIALANQELINSMLIEYDYSSSPEYICLPDFYLFSKALRQEDIKDPLCNSFVSLPDGKPLAALLKNYSKEVTTVSGYKMILHLLQSSHTHFFYGTDESTLRMIEENINRKYPEAKVLGYLPAPWVNVNEIKDSVQISKDITFINSKNPDIVWLGISSPKQDILMYNFTKKLNRGLFIGVGGVFDYLAEKTKPGPDWIKRYGLRWLYKLMQNPKKYYRKNLNNFLSLHVLIRIYIANKLLLNNKKNSYYFHNSEGKQ